MVNFEFKHKGLIQYPEFLGYLIISSFVWINQALSGNFHKFELISRQISSFPLPVTDEKAITLLPESDF